LAQTSPAQDEQLEVSDEPVEQRECEQLPCGGTVDVVIEEHVPPLHVEPEPHALPQLPQFASLVAVSTHEPLQSVPPPLHEQAPPLHDEPEGQAVPQPPQF